MSYFFIINPESGLRKDIIPLIDSVFAPEKINYKISFSREKGHVRELSQKAVIEGFQTIVAVGGDGTIREAAEPLIGKKNILGIIPCGSGNGLARNLFIPMDIRKSAEGLLAWGVRKIDAALANGNPFFCASGMGIDAEIAKRFNRRKGRRGILPYFYHSAGAFLKYKPRKMLLSITQAEYEYRPFIISVLNGRQYGGGAVIAPNARLDDGILNVTVVKHISFLRALRMTPDLFNGSLLRHSDVVETFTAKTLEIRCEKETPYHLDGEDFVCDGAVKFAVLPKMLNVKAP
ncbi:MAG: diacylglycerol kinase family lipid kinase [Elusimicrobia bacterium]|nr:diacylglycerol kinase family lipid kinase [Elusimicrobiota bacterium]